MNTIPRPFKIFIASSFNDCFEYYLSVSEYMSWTWLISTYGDQELIERLNLDWYQYKEIAKNKYNGYCDHDKKVTFLSKHDARFFIEDYLEPIILAYVLSGELNYVKDDNYSY